ncbi:hypothetical protein ACKFKF_24340 [Phormidesmis sp. 146-12]
MLSLIALASSIVVIHISYRVIDDITRLLIKLIGLLGLFLSLVYVPLLIKVLIVVAISVIPCTQQPYLRQIRCSPFCIVRSNCPYSSI